LDRTDVGVDNGHTNAPGNNNEEKDKKPSFKSCASVNRQW